MEAGDKVSQRRIRSRSRRRQEKEPLVAYGEERTAEHSRERDLVERILDHRERVDHVDNFVAREERGAADNEEVEPFSRQCLFKSDGVIKRSQQDRDIARRGIPDRSRGGIANRHSGFEPLANESRHHARFDLALLRGVRLGGRRRIVGGVLG